MKKLSIKVLEAFFLKAFVNFEKSFWKNKFLKLSLKDLKSEKASRNLKSDWKALKSSFRAHQNDRLKAHQNDRTSRQKLISTSFIIQV